MKHRLSLFPLLLILLTLLFSIIGVFAFVYGEMQKLDLAQSELQEVEYSLSSVNIRIQSLLIDEYVEQQYQHWKKARVELETKFKHFSQLPTI